MYLVLKSPYSACGPSNGVGRRYTYSDGINTLVAFSPSAGVEDAKSARRTRKGILEGFADHRDSTGIEGKKI